MNKIGEEDVLFISNFVIYLYLKIKKRRDFVLCVSFQVNNYFLRIEINVCKITEAIINEIPI
ncbi:hypothetical protein CLU96_2956 [Chryseobacterium sp. 52]|nr:hypothetical protein CLU96_2956 [Chryseobacterium sp. 52]